MNLQEPTQANPSSTSASASGTSASGTSPSASAGANNTPDDRSTTFRAVEGGQEAHSGTTLLVEAYAVLWIILMGWLLLVWRKQNRVIARLDELDRVLDKAAEKNSN